MAIPAILPRIAEFENFGFGMFIHWGLYSQLGRGEWIWNLAKMPKEEYVKLFDTFTADKFDARKIARTAKNAGMNYITLTTRHHDGFSLYDTCGLSDFDAPHSAAKRDLIAEFVDACNAEGIRPIFYHTTFDWYHDLFKEDFKGYLQFFRDSVEVLCKNYGKIGGLWFDGFWSNKGADWEEDALYATIRKHQPDAIIVNNTGLDARGAAGHIELDSVTFEQGRPTPLDRDGAPKYLAAEMCQTMNDHWGFGAHDLNYKSLAELIEILCACRKVGANYLLNIGPDGHGEIPKMQEALLEGLGEWVHTCGYNNMYTGRPVPVVSETDKKDFALADGKKLFFYIHDLTIQGDAFVTVENSGVWWRKFTGVNGKIKSVKWTDNGETLQFKQDGNTAEIFTTGYPYGTNYVVRVAEAEVE